MRSAAILQELLMTTSPRKNARAVTLVEILAVVGIMALLLAVLLPGIQAARRNALWAQSQANLKNLGQFVQLYTTDNREVIPPSAFDYRTAPNPGKVRTSSPVGVGPLVGPASVGSWADILWTTQKQGPIPLMSDAITYEWRFDSPDRIFYEADPGYAKNVFRSAEDMKVVPQGTEATPFGSGAQIDETGHPGYFAGNPFFNQLGAIATNQTYRWYSTHEIKRPAQSMYLVDSTAGELAPLDTTSPSANNWNLVNTAYPYPGNVTLMLLLDLHTESMTEWASLRELEEDQGIRVLGLDSGKPFWAP
ncbi:MAG: type II secretion system protein [Planctomycetota bacterium]|nr:MAG: type II secretion system protein [Planctomycetota bacterium]